MNPKSKPKPTKVNHALYNEHGERMILDGDNELADKITLLSSQMNAGEYQLLKLLAEFNRRKGWSGCGIKSYAHWLNWKCGIDMNTAREKVRVAKCLENLPLINEAFKNAEVSYSKVRAMTRVATDENEDYLLYISRYGTASHIEQLVRKYKRVQKSEAKESIEDNYQTRDLSYYQDDDGMWMIKARLPMVEGGLLIKAIKEVAQHKFLELHRKQEEIKLEKTKLKEAKLKETKLKEDSQDKTHKNVSAEISASPLDEPEIIEKPHMGQIQADVLSQIAEHYIATANKERGGSKALKGHERCQVVLHVDAKTLQQAYSGNAHSGNNGCEHQHIHPPHLDNQWITLENAKRMSCDASILTAYEDEFGNVLNIGRNTRTVPPAIARALNIRDETCRFPGCCESNYVDFHHIQHWSHGGPTNVDNLVKLCRFHHRALHSGLYTIERQGSSDKTLSTQSKVHIDTLVFKTHQGIPIEQSPALQKCCSVQDFFAQQWPNVNSQTGRSEWTGETMDYSMAIDGLRWRDQEMVNRF